MTPPSSAAPPVPGPHPEPRRNVIVAAATTVGLFGVWAGATVAYIGCFLAATFEHDTPTSHGGTGPRWWYQLTVTIAAAGAAAVPVYATAIILRATRRAVIASATLATLAGTACIYLLAVRR